MSAYRPYPKTKPSGVEWLGDVPEGWEHLPGRRIFEQRRDSAHRTDDQLSATQKYGVIPQALFMEMEDQKVVLALSGTGSFKHVEKDDFVISLRSFQGGIEHSAYSGCVSPAYTVLRSKRSLSPRYNAHLLKCPQYIAALQAGTDGIREGKSISYEQFGHITIPIPPLPEQHQIASFLDRECGKLDALQAKQERLIELLKEKRQALISHAVTKGLDPTAKLKPSGIEWLGDVPEHWKLVSFGQCVAITGGQVDPTVEPFLNYVMIAPNHIESKMGNILALETATEQGAESGKYLCKKGDVIYSKIRPALAKACLCPQDQVLCSADMYPMRGMLGLTNEFLLKVLLSAEFTAFAIMESDRVAMPKLNRETLATTRLPIPPLAEQRSIVAHLDEKCGKIDQLKAKAERGIELLKERRSALISAAVTGKIDVRETNSTERT